MDKNSEHRIAYGFFSQKHKEMSKNWLRERIHSDNKEELISTTYQDKYYVSADEPHFIEVTTITVGPTLNTKCYRWTDCVPVGKIFIDSFIGSANYKALTKDDKNAIIQKYWS